MNSKNRLRPQQIPGEWSLVCLTHTVGMTKTCHSAEKGEFVLMECIAHKM